MSRKRISLAVALALLASFPLTGATFYTELVTKVMILAIFAMSLDLLVGYTGLVSFGHAAFFGVGAYTLGLVAPKYDAANLWLTLPAAMLAAGVAALVLAATVLVLAQTATQPPGTHPISGRRFAGVMGYQGADWREVARAHGEDLNPRDAVRLASHLFKNAVLTGFVWHGIESITKWASSAKRPDSAR